MFENNSSLVAERLKKIEALRSMGIDPYPAIAFNPTQSIIEIRNNPDYYVESLIEVRIAGRIIGRRVMGKIIFMDIIDEGSKLQTIMNRHTLGEEQWRILKLIALFDFIGVEGLVFYTQMGELSIKVKHFEVLCKSSHPMPLPKKHDDKVYDAVTDKGTLHRKRHIDLLFNQSSREIFLKRNRILKGIRNYFDSEGFIEVETPILSLAYGGAAARPFNTYLNSLDQDMFLRISPECALKRLLCGGINKVYEIGKNFRNEGIDANHSPEFTMVEWYEAYSDYEYQMIRFETLVASLCEEINGTTRIMYQGRELDLTLPWRRISIIEAIKKKIGVNVGSMDTEGIIGMLKSESQSDQNWSKRSPLWGEAVIKLFETLIEPDLWQPVFIMDHPVDVSPLTKRHRNDPRLVERFEPMIAGMEIGNSYSELNDPVEQYQRLNSQRGDKDNRYDMDQDFLEAVAQGMPQAGGTGLGVDRIVMILTGADSIRDVIFFPL